MSFRVRYSSQIRIKEKSLSMRSFKNFLRYSGFIFVLLKSSIIRNAFFEIGIFEEEYCSLRRRFLSFSIRFKSLISSPGINIG